MRKFGHYEVTAELGRGGMGVVYKGWEPSLNRRVAIKCLGEHLLNDDDLVERFTREAKATAALNDPNVIQIYFIGKEKQQPYFAMEYIEGQSLDDLLKGGKALSVNHAKNILKQACKGLSAAHKIDLVHRDIKPANLMVTTDGTLKIVDFGIARTREYGDKLTNTGEFVGTPGYLSPEVCIGKEVDERSDIFSLGIVFYEMLAGKVPFENDSPLGLMLEVVQSEIPDIRLLNKKVDKKTSYILNKMIAKSPEDRYQNCAEIMRDLGNVTDNQPLSTLKESAKIVSHPVSNKPRISEQVTLPSGVAITKNNTVITPKAKSKKSWVIAATLFTVVGAATVGYYQGYLPFPNDRKNNEGDQITALVDEQLLPSDNITQSSDDTPILNNTEENEISGVSDTPDISNNTDLLTSNNDVFSNDKQDIAQIDDTGKIDFQQNQTEGATVNQTVLGQVDDKAIPSANLNETTAGLNSSVSNVNAPVNTAASVTAKPIPSELVTVAHNTANQNLGVVESKMQSHTKASSLHPDNSQSIPKTKPKSIKLNKGVVVIVFGDPAVANPIEKILENQLKQQGIKVMNEQFISGMKQLLDNGLDLAEMKNLIERNGGQAMVIANVNYVGSQELIYAGRATELVNAQIDIDTYDIKTGDSIGAGFGSQINYTALNATDKASAAVLEFTDQLVTNLKGKI